MKHGTLVRDLADDKVARQSKGSFVVVRNAILGPSQQYIAGNGSFDPGEEPAVSSHERDFHAEFGAMPHQCRRYSNGSEADDAAQQV